MKYMEMLLVKEHFLRRYGTINSIFAKNAQKDLQIRSIWKCF